MKPRVFIEILSRLETCYVFIKSEKKVKQLSLKQNAICLIYSDETEDCIKVDCVMLKPDTVSSLEFYDPMINFRVQMEKISSKFSDCSQDAVAETNFKPKFGENLLVPIKCRCCEHQLFDPMKFTRILPLPSGVLDTSDFFCHDHSDSLTKSSLIPGKKDCFYGNFFVLLCPEFVDSSKVLHCKRCFSWLGTYQDKILKLWDCSCVLSDENTGSEQLEAAYSQFRQIIRHISSTSFYGSIKIVVESLVEENETNYLLLWIIDDHLICLVDSKDQVPGEEHILLVQKQVSKVLYLFQEEKTALVQSWIKNINVVTIDVAKQMLLSALSNLNTLNKKLPLESRKTNGMYLSYLDPIL